MCHQVKSEFLRCGFGIQMLSIGIDINYFLCCLAYAGPLFLQFHQSRRGSYLCCNHRHHYHHNYCDSVSPSLYSSQPGSAHHTPLLSPVSLQEVPFARVWCSNRQPLHCAFSLERYTPTTTQLSCKICIRQLKGHEQILQVQTSILEVSPWSAGPLDSISTRPGDQRASFSRATQGLKELRNALALNPWYR